MKRITAIFILAFIFNAIWENLHVFLYSNYMGGPITEFILLRASLFDALLIVIISLPFIFVPRLKNLTWLIVIIGIIIAILNEFYGLGTARWAYNQLMPIIPFLGTGLTPTIQLGLLGYLAFKISNNISAIISE